MSTLRYCVPLIVVALLIVSEFLCIHAATQSNVWNNRQNSTIVNTNPLWQGPSTTPWPELAVRKPYNRPASSAVSSSTSQVSVPNQSAPTNRNNNVNTNVGANLSYGSGTGVNVGQNVNTKAKSSGNIDGIALSYGLNYNRNSPSSNQGKPISPSSSPNVYTPKLGQSYSNVVRQNSNDQSNSKASENTRIPTVKPLMQKVNSHNVAINTINVQQPSKTTGTVLQPTTPASTSTVDEDEELRQFSETLLRKDVNNAGKYVTINYQGKTTSRSTNDEAALPLLTIQKEAYNIPSISNLTQLHNNYIIETNVNEHVSAQEKMEENALLDSLLSTPVMQYTRNFLIQKGAIPKDPKLFKDKLKEIWFNMYSRGQGKIGSSGFEHIFLAEIKNQDVTGLHNWLYFHEAEVKNSVNYLGYMKKLEMNNNKGAILKFHMNLNGIDKPVSSMFIGTSPELEIALYSTCFLLRPDQVCPLRFDGKRFIIRTYTFRYRGKNMIGSAFPEI